MKRFYLTLLSVCGFCLGAASLKAQPSLFISGEINSSYNWRGVEFERSYGSMMPSIGVEWNGFSLENWNMFCPQQGYVESDITLAYETDHLRLAVTDYFFKEEGLKYFKNYRESHTVEGSVAWYFGDRFPLTVAWNTFFWGDQDIDEEGKRYFSSYLELSYEYDIPRWMTLTGTLGMAPFYSPYWMEYEEDQKGFQVSKLGLRADRTLFEYKKLSCNIWGEGLYNFGAMKPYFNLGLTVNFSTGD